MNKMISVNCSVMHNLKIMSLTLLAIRHAVSLCSWWQ